MQSTKEVLMKFTCQSLTVFALFALVMAPGIASAQQSPLEIDNIPTIAGLVAGMAPDYPGSSDYKAVAAPFAKYTLPGSYRYAILRGTELSFNLVDHPIFRLGPMVNFRPERGNVKDSRVDRMTKIDSTVEGGCFAGLEFIDRTNARRRIAANLTWLHDLSGVHNGWLLGGSVRVTEPVAQAWDVSLGISSTYGDNAYTSTYFGVDFIDSFRSGLQIFRARSGFRDVSATPAIVYHYCRNWHFAGGFRYMRLLNDAEDSPLVDNRGSANQFLVGLGVLYSW